MCNVQCGRLVVVRRCILQVGWEGSEQRQAGHNSSGQYQLHQHHRHQQLWPVLSNRGCQAGASAPGWDPSRGRGARPGGIALRRVQMCLQVKTPAQRAGARGVWVAGGRWHVACGCERSGMGVWVWSRWSYIRTVRQPSRAAAGDGGGLGWGWGWLTPRGGHWWPSIRFVMAERTVCVCARGCGCGCG